jgi:hypothetical protein
MRGKNEYVSIYTVYCIYIYVCVCVCVLSVPNVLFGIYFYLFKWFSEVGATLSEFFRANYRCPSVFVLIILKQTLMLIRRVNEVHKHHYEYRYPYHHCTSNLTFKNGAQSDSFIGPVRTAL